MSNGRGYKLTRVALVERVSPHLSIVTLDCGHDHVASRPLHAGMRVYCKRHDPITAAVEAFEREMWPQGPAHGSGSGIWAAHRDRIIDAARDTAQSGKGETPPPRAK